MIGQGFVWTFTVRKAVELRADYVRAHPRAVALFRHLTAGHAFFTWCSYTVITLQWQLSARMGPPGFFVQPDLLKAKAVTDVLPILVCPDVCDLEMIHYTIVVFEDRGHLLVVLICCPVSCMLY